MRDKVLTPLGIPATRGDVEAAAAAAPGAAEWILALVRRRAGAGDRPAAPAWRGAVIDRGGWRTAGVTGTPSRPSPGRSPAPEPRGAPPPAPHDVERREEEENGAADEAAAADAASDDPAALRRAVAALERALVRAEARIEALTAQLAAVNGGGGGSPTSAKARFVACLSPRRGASPVRE